MYTLLVSMLSLCHHFHSQDLILNQTYDNGEQTATKVVTDDQAYYSKDGKVIKALHPDW